MNEIYHFKNGFDCIPSKYTSRTSVTFFLLSFHSSLVKKIEWHLRESHARLIAVDRREEKESNLGLICRIIEVTVENTVDTTCELLTSKAVSFWQINGFTRCLSHFFDIFYFCLVSGKRQKLMESIFRRVNLMSPEKKSKIKFLRKCLKNIFYLLNFIWVNLSGKKFL